MKTEHKSTQRSDPTRSILPWLGALGHTFFVLEPDDSESGKIYGGWRTISESASLAHAVCDGIKPGQQVWQLVTKRAAGGAIKHSYREVTP